MATLTKSQLAALNWADKRLNCFKHLKSRPNIEDVEYEMVEPNYQTMYQIRETRSQYGADSVQYFGFFDTYEEAYDNLPEDFYQGSLSILYDVVGL